MNFNDHFMSAVDQFEMDEQVVELGHDIERVYKKFEMDLELKHIGISNDRVFFKVKLKKKTRKKDLLAFAEDVQRRLKLPIFLIDEHNFVVYLIVSRKEIRYPQLPRLLYQHNYIDATATKELPYVVGFGVSGNVIFSDLASDYHLLMGGSSGSGKSSFLRSLVTCLAFTKSPQEVNFIIIDVGENDLLLFTGIPHLACPVVQDRNTAVRTLMALKDEMDRRVSIEYERPQEFQSLPRLVLVIDELPALMRGVTDKGMSDTLVHTITSLLERGRHNKISVVLAAQNPIQRNIKLDLSNITARIAFWCAKGNYSETIIDDDVATDLAGKGDLYFKRSDGLHRVQGVYISADNTKKMVRRIIRKYGHSTSPNKFTIPERCTPSQLLSSNTKVVASSEPAATGPTTDECLFANVAYFVVTSETISSNQIRKKFHISWDRADKYLQRFYRLGIIGDPDGKLPRDVFVRGVEDIPEELLGIMKRSGIDREDIENQFIQKS